MGDKGLFEGVQGEATQIEHGNLQLGCDFAQCVGGEANVVEDQRLGIRSANKA